MLEIKKIQIKNILVDVNDSLPKEFELKTECRAKVKVPKNQDNISMLLNMELNVMTVNTEDLKINIKAAIIFELDEVPNDYVSFAEKECIPAAQERLYNKVDEILVVMGYNKMKLAEKMNEQK